jgi:uncharacterized integral membrane protein
VLVEWLITDPEAPLIVTLIIMALIGLIGPLFVGGSRVPSQTRQH